MSVLAPLLAALLLVVSAGGDLDDAIARFHAVAQTGTLTERRGALDELVATAHPDAAVALVDEYGRRAAKLRLDRREAGHLAYALDRRRAVLASWEALAERDEEAAHQVPREQRAVRELEADLAKVEGRIAAVEPWCDALAAGMTDLCARIGDAKARRVLGDLEERAEEGSDLGQRLAAVELLGRVGPAGTALEIHRRISEWQRERSKLERKLPKLLKEVREVEERMQTEAERTGGSHGPGTQLLYDKAVAEANAVRRRTVDLQLLVEAAARAGGVALGREEGEELAKSLKALVRGLTKEKGRLRLVTLTLVANARGERVDAELGALLEAADEPLLVAEVLDALVARAAPGTEERILGEGYLTHAHAHVRSRAAAGLAALRSRAGVPALIDRLEAEEGRLRTDVGNALASLTGEDFHGNVTLWRRWWDDHRDDFEVVSTDAARAVEAGAPAGGVTFFGIHTESRRVLFVIDVSGSMDYTTAPRPGVDETNPRSRPQMLPKAGEVPRLVAMKRDLVKALGGLEDGGWFNLVLYASDVWTWADDLVEMDAESRAEVLEFVDDLRAVGGTNIHGALSRAFELAGVPDASDGRWAEPAVDTIYLMTDGRASVGVTTDVDEILAMVRERNRTAGIVLHTIGLADGHDAVLLRSLAEENGGTYVGR